MAYLQATKASGSASDQPYAPRTRQESVVSQQRVLLVDDEPGILTTYQQILSNSGFEVAVASTVAAGLALVQTREFDALITDLNIGQPADGFTLVSAMRRTQPDAVTIIITGFPAFDSALEAIRSQVDDYFVKPTDVNALLDRLRTRLNSPKRHYPLPMKRVADVVAERKDKVISDWLQRLRAGCEHAGPFSDDELINNVPKIVDELVRAAREHSSKVSEAASKSASHHGDLRCRQGFPVDVFLRESRFLRQSVMYAVHSAMLEVNLSYVFTDVAMMSESLDAQLELSMSSYLACHDVLRRTA
jgi:ActR/RegA family two-component response regulator